MFMNYPIKLCKRFIPCDGDYKYVKEMKIILQRSSFLMFLGLEFIVIYLEPYRLNEGKR